MKLYDELAGMAECVPLQRKHFNDEKGERCIAVKYRLIFIFQIKVWDDITVPVFYAVILIGLANPDSQSGSGSKQAKVVPNKGKKLRNFMFEVLSVGLESSP